MAKIKFVNYHTKYFRGGRVAAQLICKGDNIFMPTILKKYIVNVYKTYILYPILDNNETTISHRYYWHTLRDNIRTHIKVTGIARRKINEA